MANVIEIVIKQTSSGNAITGVTKELGSLGKTADTSGGALSRLTGTMGTLGSVAAGVGVAGIVGVGVALGTAATAGLSFNNTMEQASAKINAFTKDADLTAQILEDVRLEAAKTPFEFDQMANAVSGLLPAAKQADVGIMDLLRDAEILAASNPAEGLEGAAFALREAVSGDFTSVIERFNLPRQMINELKEKGIPDLEIVRTAMKEMGYDMDLVSALANTAQGRWSTLKDTFTNLAGTVTQPIFDAFSSGLGGINDWLTLISPQLEAFANMLAGQVSGAITAVVTSIDKIAGAYQRFGIKGAARSILGQLGFDPETIKQVTSIVDTITQSFDKISGAYERFGARGAATSILGQLGMDPTTIGTIRTTIDTITENIGILQQVFAQFGAQGAGVSLLSMLGLSSETIGLITTSIQGVVDAFSALSNWWITNWPIMQAAALTAWQVIQSIFAGIMTALQPVYAELFTTFGQLGASLQQLGTTLSELGINWSSVFNALLQATGIVAAAIGAALLGVLGVITGVVSGAVSGINSIIQTFMALWEQVGVIFGGIGMIITGWIQVFHGDFSGLTTVIQGAVTMWQGIFGSFATIVTGTIGTVLSVVGGFVSGIVGFFQGMYDTLVGNSIVPDLINDIVAWFKKLPQMALAALSDLGAKVIKPFQDMAVTIKEEVNEGFSNFIDDTIPAFIKGFELVIEGVKNFISSIKEAASTVADMAIPDWLQMHSPPPLATALNMVAGGATNAAQAIAGMQKSLVTNRANGLRFVDDLNMGGIAKSHLAGGGQWKQFRKIIKGNILANMQGLADGTVDILGQITQVATQFNFPPSMAAEFAKTEGLIDHLTGSFAKFKKEIAIENLGNMVQMAGQFSSLGQSFADMLTAGDGGETQAQIKALQSFLAGKEQSFRMFKEFEDGTTSEFFWDRNRAQEELNQLLEEQKKQEEMITKQKEAQQKLSFLQSQLDLLKLGQGLGGNIFQGITFGLNASVEDLLAATNAVTEAMINQIDQDLQIASPSKVMFDKFKNQVGGAMVGGLMAVKPMLERVAGPMLDPLTGAGTSSSKVTNNYFNQTVNTRAESSSVIGDFRTMQLMAG